MTNCARGNEQRVPKRELELTDPCSFPSRNSDISIRPYAPADAEACTRIFDRAWHAGHPYAPRRIDAAEFSANTRNETILVADVPGHGVAGFVSVYEPESFVHNLYVEPDLHGSGIGKTLLACAVALAGGTASLKCQARAAQALAFYRHLGWSEITAGIGEFGEWVTLRSPG